MKTKFLMFLLGVSFCLTYPLLAQETQTLENQIQELIDKSNRYQDYKVVKINKLNSLKKSVSDSINQLKNSLETNYSRIGNLESTIDSLEQNLKNTKNALVESQKKEDGIYLFGILLKKSSYNTILWSIIGIMLLLTLFFLFRYKRSNSITKDALAKLNETEEEFESHRQRALEREQQIRRKLQDELNKQKKS